jgi:hypothetical protein
VIEAVAEAGEAGSECDHDDGAGRDRGECEQPAAYGGGLQLGGYGRLFGGVNGHAV